MGTACNLPSNDNRGGYSDVKLSFLLIGLALILFIFGCGGNVPLPPLPPGPVCGINGVTTDCYVLVNGVWVYVPGPQPLPSPSPSASPTPAPTPTPTPSPSPTPRPSPTPSPCIPETMTVPACDTGYTDCWFCSALIWNQVNIHHNWDPVPGSNPPLYFNDSGNDASKRQYLDSDCNLVRRDGSIISRNWLGEGCHGNVVCPPDKTVTVPCPDPSPSPNPNPTPAPGDGPSNTCPNLTCIHVAVHNVMGPDFLPRDRPVIGGYVVLDTTPLFETCTSAGRCNDELHWRCTKAQRDHVHIDSSDYRHCEDDSGPCWEQTTGSFVERRIQSPGDNDRGFQLRAGPFREPGQYCFRAWGGTRGCPWRDGLGIPVTGEGSGEACFNVE